MSWPRHDTNKCILVQLLWHICLNNMLRAVNKFSLKRRPLSTFKQVKLLSDLIVTKHFDYYWKGKWSKNYCIARSLQTVSVIRQPVLSFNSIINSPLKKSSIKLTAAFLILQTEPNIKHTNATIYNRCPLHSYVHWKMYDTLWPQSSWTSILGQLIAE